jgi:hypothetical protein
MTKLISQELEKEETIIPKWFWYNYKKNKGKKWKKLY